LQKIRELLADAGGAAELRHWIKVALKKPAGKRGRPRGDKWEEVDFWLLQEVNERARSDGRLLSVYKLIEEVVAEEWQAGRRVGQSQGAVVRRLFSRIRPTVLRLKVGEKVWKVTFSKPQFESPLTQSVQPRGKHKITVPPVMHPGLQSPDLSDTSESPPRTYQPGSVEWQKQQEEDQAERTAQ
jgi:hypothetical protein